MVSRDKQEDEVADSFGEFNVAFRKYFKAYLFLLFVVGGWIWLLVMACGAAADVKYEPPTPVSQNQRSP